MKAKKGKRHAVPALAEAGSAADIWRFLLESKNIQPAHYDADIVAHLCESLGLAHDLDEFIAGRSDFGQALDAHHVSKEQFISALFSAVQPFAQMMSNLFSFFERHAVRGTERTLRMQFDFEDVDKELTFDLEHFRDWLRVWEETQGMVEMDCWDLRSIWQIHSALGTLSTRSSEVQVRDRSAGEWVAMNRYPGRQHATAHWSPPPRPSPVGVPEIDTIVARVFRVIAAVVTACAPFRNYAALVARSDQARATRPRQNDSPGSAAHAAPPIEWEMETLRVLESDYFSGTTMGLLWYWIEQLASLPVQQRLRAARSVLGQLEKVFASTPTKQVPGAVKIENLIAFLNLPVWKQRPALYSAWMLPVVEQALHDYPIEIHDDSGTLRFSFKATRMATFKSTQGDIVLVAEHKSRLDHPVGKGRTANVQPDYVLFVGDTQEPENARVVLELKQYLRPSPQKFSDVLTDYANAFINASVVLADYGPMPSGVVASLPTVLAQRATALGDVRPSRPEELATLQKCIRAALPSPERLGGDAPMPSKVSTIVLDVSGSMRDVLLWPSVRDELQKLARMNPDATWVAIDVAVRTTERGPGALDKILGIEMVHDTNLRVAGQYAAKDSVVVTDEEGATQLRGAGINPGGIGLARATGIEWLSRN